jgi:hypothetical protein
VPERARARARALCLGMLQGDNRFARSAFLSRERARACFSLDKYPGLQRSPNIFELRCQTVSLQTRCLYELTFLANPCLFPGLAATRGRATRVGLVPRAEAVLDVWRKLVLPVCSASLTEGAVSPAISSRTSACHAECAACARPAAVCRVGRLIVPAAVCRVGRLIVHVIAGAR